MIVDKYLLEDFVEFLIDNYDLASARKRWITHGTKTGHSFESHEDRTKVALIQDIAEQYAAHKNFTVSNAFDSAFLNDIALNNAGVAVVNRQEMWKWWGDLSVNEKQKRGLDALGMAIDTDRLNPEMIEQIYLYNLKLKV